MAERQRDQEPENLVRADSDELLAAVDELRRIEAEKRAVPYSSEEFHRRAREVEERARSVFELALRETVHGEIESDLDGAAPADPRGWPGGTTEGSPSVGDAGDSAT